MTRFLNSVCVEQDLEKNINKYGLSIGLNLSAYQLDHTTLSSPREMQKIIKIKAKGLQKKHFPIKTMHSWYFNLSNYLSPSLSITLSATTSSVNS